MPFDIEKLTKSLTAKAEELKNEVFLRVENQTSKEENIEKQKLKNIENYEREDSLSKVIADRLSTITLNDRIDKGLEERKKIIQEKLKKEIDEIRQINEDSLKSMGKK